jgi:hypothetical protein
MPHAFSKAHHLLAAGLCALGLNAVLATTVAYDNAGTFIAPSLTLGGVSVTGSNTVGPTQFDGLGVVGGFGEPFHAFDGGEYLDLDCSGLGGATNVSYFNSLAGDLNGGPLAERTVSDFGINGDLLGNFDENDNGDFNLSSLVGGATIERFRLQMRGDDMSVDILSFTAALNYMPEPDSFTLARLALLGLAGIRAECPDASRLPGRRSEVANRLNVAGLEIERRLPPSDRALVSRFALNSVGSGLHDGLQSGCGATTMNPRWSDVLGKSAAQPPPVPQGEGTALERTNDRFAAADSAACPTAWGRRPPVARPISSPKGCRRAWPAV